MVQGTKLTWREFEENCRKILERTPVPANESASAKHTRVEQAKRDYEYFFSYYFPMYATAPCGWFHVFIANLLLANKFIRLLLDWFRGCAKSVHADLGYPMWLMINGQMKCMLLVGENRDKACTLLSDIQGQLTSNQRFINDFGEQFSYGSWEGGTFKTKQGVSFFAIGIGQSPRGLRNAGMRPDYIVVDDVDSEELSNNPKRVRKLLDWVCDALMGCFDGPVQRFVVVNNRPFVHSVIGYLIVEKMKGCVDVPLSQIKRGAKAAKAFLYQTKGKWHRLMVNAVDDMVNFNPSWEGKYTPEYWRQMCEDKSHRSWMREYMNTPVVEGSIFKNDWIKWKPALPLNEYDYLIAYADPSWKNTANSDHKAVVFIGKKGGEYHLLKIFNRVASIDTMVRYLYDLYESVDINRKKRPFSFPLAAGVTVDFWIEATMNQDLHLEAFYSEGETRGSGRDHAVGAH